MSKKNTFVKKFEQNKINRVTNKEKRYNKAERSKSDEAYIKGDYKSSVSKRSYGIKKQLAEGKTVNGYGSDYIDTKGMKRSRYIKKMNGENPYEATKLYTGKATKVKDKDGKEFTTRTRYLTDEEKESYKNTGELYHKNYRKNKSFLDTERHEGGKFKDRLKTFDGNKIKWDGLETAKYNQKDGKHLNNIVNYAVGLGKDLVADPIVDALKTVDRYESAITNGVYAGVEQLSNIADGKGATKDLIKDVVKHSLKESDETGWGTSSADNWRNMAKRNGAKLNGFQDSVLGVTGLVADVLNPIDLGGKVVGIGKSGLKGAKNTLKGIENATDIMSHAPGFVPKSLTDVRGKNVLNKLSKSSGASDEIFFTGKPNKALDNTHIDRALNNAYDVAMSKSEPISTGKPKVDSFIEKLRRKGNSEESGMFPYNAHQFNIKPSDDEFRELLAKQGDDLVNTVDNMPEHKQDKFYDYLLKKDPELYNTLVYESDIIDDTIESTTRRRYETKEDKNFKDVLKQENLRDIKIDKPNNQPKFMAHELESKVVDPRKIDYKKALSSYNSLGKKLPTDLTEISGDIEMFREMLEVLPKGNSKADKKQVSQIINKLNDRYFDSKDVISLNASGKDVRQLVEHLDVLLNKRLSGVSDNLISDIDKHYKFRPSLVDPNFNNKLTKRTELLGESVGNIKAKKKLIELDYKNGKISPIERKTQLNALDSKKRELDEWWNKYKSYTPDEWEKEFPTQQKEYKGFYDAVEEYSKKDFTYSDIENYKQDLRDSLEIDEFVKSELPYDMHVREVIENEPELLIDPNQKQILQKSYQERINRLKETHIQKLTDKEFGLDIKDEIGGEKLRNQKRNLEARQVGENLSQAPLAEKELLNGVGEVSDNKNIKARINHLRQTLKIDKPKQIKGKIKLSNGQKLKDLPPVQENLKGLRNLITKEVEYRYKNANTYSDMQEAFKTMKREYVEALRNLGVPDKGYFHKVQKLQNDLDVYFKELQNPSKVSTPFMKMDLQKLARKISDTFDEIGDSAIVDDMSDILNGTNEIENYLSPELMAKMDFDKATSKGSKQTKIDGRTLNKKYTQTKDGYTPQIKEETPLDLFGETTDEQFNLFDKMFGKAPKEEKATNNIPKDIQEQKLQELDEKIAKRMTPQRMAEILGEPLEDVLKNANKPVNISGEEIVQGWRKNADKTGVPNGVEWEDLFKEDKGIKEVFEELSSNGIDVTKQPPKEKPADMQPNLYKKWINAWKKGVTIYNPGWHVQNYLQNKGQNYFALGNKAFKPQTDAKNILKTIQGKDAKSVNIRGMGNSELAKLAENLGVIDSFGDDIQIANSGIFGAIENSKPMQKLQDIEKNARLHHFLEQIKSGMTPEDAAKSVNKYLYDYSKENKFDKAMKNIDPFWTFHKNNARMLTQSAIEHPSRMTKIMRADRGLDGDIPEEYKQSDESMYREHQASGKTYTDSKDRQYNYLYDQQMFSDISDALPINEESLIGKLNPLLQIALRTAKGEGRFGNKLVSPNKKVEDGWEEMLYEDAGYNNVSTNVALKEALLDVNPILPTVFEMFDKTKADKIKGQNGKMPEQIASKRELNEWIEFITGHKGNWYRNTK